MVDEEISFFDIILEVLKDAFFFIINSVLDFVFSIVSTIFDALIPTDNFSDSYLFPFLSKVNDFIPLSEFLAMLLVWATIRITLYVLRVIYALL